MVASLALFIGSDLAGLARVSAEPLTPTSDSLTVEECVALARQRAPDVRALSFSREAARLDSIAVAHNRRPAYSVFGGTMIAPNGFYDPVATNLGEYELKAGFQVPLADGGARHRERMRGALSAQDAIIESARASRDAGLRTAAVALDALRAREEATALSETLAWLERLRLLVASEVRGGSRDRTDADRVGLESDAVRSDLESLLQSQAALGRELSQLTGVWPNAAELREPSAPDGAPAATDSVTLLAEARRAPEVRAANAAVLRQQLALEDARRKNALRVDLSADAGIWGTDLTHAVPPDLAAEQPGATFSDRLRRDLGASLTLHFQNPILDRAAGYGVSARESDLRAAEALAGAAETERARAAMDLLGRWRAAERRLALADSSAHRAEDHLLRLRSLYAAGSTTLLELLDARRQLDEARSRRAEARMDERLARWQELLQ
jgi:outer membrane protein TolC